MPIQPEVRSRRLIAFCAACIDRWLLGLCLICLFGVGATFLWTWRLDSWHMTGDWRETPVAAVVPIAAVSTFCATALGGLLLRRHREMDRLRRRLAVEQEHRALATRMASVTQHANDIVLMMDETGKIVEANDCAIASYGYTLDELRELPPGGLRGPGGATHLVQQMELFDTAGTHFEVLHQRKDGSTFSVEVSGRSCEIEGRTFNLAIVRDISKRKANEQQIERLHRLYAALSHINQAIVHLRTRETLLPAICQILVEQGGFKMAWIGWRDPSTEIITPVASFGDTDGFLTKVLMRADSGPESSGPTQTALRDARTYVCHDFFSDPCTAVWRETAARHGLRAAVALPVTMDGHAVGVLSVYADRENLFVRQEIDLLEEASSDISFAVENFEREAQSRQVKAALRQSEEEHRRLFLNHPGPMWVFDMETLRFLSVNDAAVRHYGYSREEFLALTIKDIRASGDIAALLESLAVHAHETRISGAVRHRKKDGSIIVVEVCSQPVQFDGRAARLVFAQDVTERHHAEEALRTAHATLRRLVDSNVVGILIGDAEGRVEEANDYYLDLIGYTRKEFEGGEINWRAVTPPEWMTVSDQAIREMRQHGTCAPYEKEYLRRDGTRVPVFLTTTALPGENERFAAFVLDLTVRKRNEIAIQQSLSLLRATLESTADGLLVVTADGKITSYNQQFLAMWGIPESVMASGDDAQALGAVLGELKEPEVFLAKVKELYAHPESDSFDVLRFKDGRIFERYSQPQLIEGKAVGRVWSFRDVTVRYRAEEALRDSERRQRLALHVGHIGAFEFDLESGGGTYTTELAEIWGIPADFDGNVSEFYWQHVHADDVAAAKQKYAAILESGESDSMELRLTRPDGEVRWLQWQAQVIKDVAGQPARVVGVCMDITQRKRAEEQLVLLITAIMATPTCVVITDERGAIEWVNPAFTATTGYALEEAVGKNPRILKSGQQSDEFYTDLWSTIVSGRNWSGEFINRRKDGVLYIEEATISPVRDPSGAIRHFLAIKQDITVRKESERRIREQAELLDKANEAIVVVDLDHRITFWNHGAERLLGWSAAEMIGSPASRVFPLTEAGTDDDVINAIATVGDWRGEVLTHNRNGHPITLETSITVLYDEKKRPTGRLKISTDITEKKKLAEQFLRAQRLESIGMLAAGIAHDLNNVLAPIGMASTLLRDHVSDSNDVRLLDTLEKSTARGAGLVRQILGFAHGAGGEHRVVQVKHLLRDIIGVITETFPKSIVVEYQVPNDLWPVMGNATQIHQVLLNLCVNARDAMPQGGNLCVGAENCLLDVSAARALEQQRGHRVAPGPWLVLQVKDTGTGIPPEILPRIWEPFFTTKGTDKGTGLGLSTVRGIVETHHGFVTLQTSPGEGTDFQVYLPATMAAVTADGADVPCAGRGHGELILLVDDESFIREAAGAILTHGGYEVIAACDGTAAAALFELRADEISLVITDRDMPSLDGAGLASVIRQRDPSMKILAISGLASSTAGRESVSCQFADAFLPKPFTAQTLLNSVAQLLAGPTADSYDAKLHG
jgi:PAS domain S-box-containing protein